MNVKTKQFALNLLDNKIIEITDEQLTYFFANETTENIYYIRDALKLNKSVSTINLKHYNLSYYKKILDGLKINKSVKFLKIKCYFNEDINFLSEIISKNTSIINLNITLIDYINVQNGLMSDFTSLKQALITNKSITKLKIKYKPKKSNCTHYKMLKFNKNITPILESVLYNNVNNLSFTYIILNYDILLNVLKTKNIDKLKLWKCRINFDILSKINNEHINVYNVKNNYFNITGKKIILNQKYEIPRKNILYKDDYIKKLETEYNELINYYNTFNKMFMSKIFMSKLKI